MSSSGFSECVVNTNLTFDDAAPTTIGTDPVSGRFKPADRNRDNEFFAPPAPAGPYSDTQLLSVFNGVNPNGT